MFGLIPWRRERAEVLPEEQTFGLLRRDMADVFDRLMGRWPLIPDWVAPPKVTGLSVEETEKAMLVHAELPGIDAKEIEVSVTGNVLTIKAAHEVATKKGEKEEKEMFRVQRSLTLPPEVDAEKIEAAYRNGVLELRLPKLPEAVGRRIEVKT